MKYLKLSLGMLAIAVLMNSCLLTFHPIYTEKDVVFQPGLFGSYQKPGKDEFMDIHPLSRYSQIPEGLKKIRDKGYFIQFREDENAPPVEYITFLVQLDGKFYMDFYPVTRTFGPDDFYNSLHVPLHALFKVQTTGLEKHSAGILTMQRFDGGFLTDLIKTKKIRIKHEKLDDEYIITASTNELQQYVIKYSNNEKAYEKDLVVYQKIK